MKIHEIRIYQEFDVPVEQVWDAFNDHENFGKIMGQKIDRIKDSTDPGNVNGTGSVRYMKLPTGAFEETITKSEKPSVIEYKITKGTPLHHHFGKLQFTSLPQGRSALNYSIDLGSKIPFLGSIVRRGLEKGIASGLRHYGRKLSK